MNLKTILALGISLFLTGCYCHSMMPLCPDHCIVDNQFFCPGHNCIGDTGRWINYHGPDHPYCIPTCIRYGRIDYTESCRRLYPSPCGSCACR